ncbi:MAG: hypothetical protein QMD92_01155, partial [bacterium]|nr:hypothetical protein [bacterium]
MAWSLPTTGDKSTKAYADEVIRGEHDEYIYNMAEQIKEYKYAVMITPLDLLRNKSVILQKCYNSF